MEIDERKFGFYRKEIKELLRMRIYLKGKVRYHSGLIDELNDKIKKIEEQLSFYEK